MRNLFHLLNKFLLPTKEELVDTTVLLVEGDLDQQYTSAQVMHQRGVPFETVEFIRLVHTTVKAL